MIHPSSWLSLLISLALNYLHASMNTFQLNLQTLLVSVPISFMISPLLGYWLPKFHITFIGLCCLWNAHLTYFLLLCSFLLFSCVLLMLICIPMMDHSNLLNYFFIVIHLTYGILIANYHLNDLQESIFIYELYFIESSQNYLAFSCWYCLIVFIGYFVFQNYVHRMRFLLLLALHFINELLSLFMNVIFIFLEFIELMRNFNLVSDLN